MQQTDKTERFEPEQSYPVADNTVISLQLKTADKNPDIDPNIPSGWADFRGTAYDANGNMTGTANTNNGVTRAKTCLRRRAARSIGQAKSAMAAVKVQSAIRFWSVVI